MRSATARLWRWLRGHAFIVALVTAGLVVAGAIAWVAIDLARPPDVAEHGHWPYLEAQQRLHVQEARAQLAVLASALAADRPVDNLAARAERLRADLSWAVRPSTALERVWSDIDAELERLVEQIRSEDPDAGATLARVRALVAGSGERP